MKHLNKFIRSPLFYFAFISFAIFFFYLRYINFSIDTIILFLSSKIFLGKWLLRGIFPLYNPHIYLGIPFAFDVGLGNFHPFNLFFLMPYPYSFAIWVSASSFLMMSGFYMFFRLFTKTKWFAFVIALIFFFSGSGLLRTNNPTIYLVIAHYGIYLYSLSFLKSQKTRSFLFPLITGIFMTLAGHIQFVFYGYILGLLVSVFVYRIKMLKVFQHFVLLLLFTSWYYIFSLPLIFQSTRLTFNKDYVNTGKNSILHYLQLLLPYYLGYVQNGSKWNVGPTYTILTSLFFPFLLGYLIYKKRVQPQFLIILAVLFIASLGLINLPFFRGAGQVTILIHVFGLIAMAQNEDFLVTFIRNIRSTKLIFVLALLVLAGISFFYSDLFRIFFLLVYKIAKHGSPGLFFDNATIRAVGQLIGLSLISLLLFIISLLVLVKTRKTYAVIASFIILEGLMFNYFHGFYIPASILTQKQELSKSINSNSYRIQTASDVVPYFGVATYMGDILFRPPFSKEVSIYNNKERVTLAYLKNLFSFIPSTWVMTTDYYSVQGFDTFIPKKLTDMFIRPSDDFKEVYGDIIKRNNLFGTTKTNVSINALETSQITLNDPRWQELGVRYLLSNRPLQKYKLISQNSSSYIYENEATKPIYRIESGDNIKALTPSYQDPNQIVFTIGKNDVGKMLVANINPDGFEISMNGKTLENDVKGFSMTVFLKTPGRLTVRYSPLAHLKQVLSGLIKKR